MTMYHGTTFIMPVKETKMKSMTHYRHATSIIELDGKRLLVDPLFADKGSYPPIVNTKNPRRNPLVGLPVPYGDLLDVDGVIITHNHNDHFDRLAKAEIPGDIPLLCQEEDCEAFLESGFTNITALGDDFGWLDFDCQRIKGYHGGHVFRNKLGTSSAFHIKGRESDVYITGDTLLTPAVRRSLKKISPHNIIAYGGRSKNKDTGEDYYGPQGHKENIRPVPPGKSHRGSP